MVTSNIRIRSRDGPAFDCYLALPEANRMVPAVVLASTIHGVDADLRGIADRFASRGFIAAAPDLFWRTVPGPLLRGDARAVQRAETRLEKIRTGEHDLADVLSVLRTQALFNGRALIIGFCYGGPYAILGPKRLGYDAGLACHGTQMLDFASELEGMRQPVCMLWGDRDRLAPAPVLEVYRGIAARMENVEMHVFAGAQHGFMLQGNTKAFDERACRFSMARAFALLESLCGEQQ